MLISRLFACIVMCSTTAAMAQENPVQQQPSTPTAKPDKSQQVACRVLRDGNQLHRVCMTNYQWAEADKAKSGDAMANGYNNHCTSMTTTTGAC